MNIVKLLTAVLFLMVNVAEEVVQYTFRYGIDNDPVFAQHWEERTGDIVHGAYSFLESPGQVRTVNYAIEGDGGFKAVVAYRKPPGYPLVGHLKYPKNDDHPITLAEPVGIISNDLFRKERTYPNLSQ